MTNICAAIGVAQLENAGKILSRKRQIASWYNDGLAGLPLTFHKELVGTKHSWWMYSILTSDSADRSELRNELRLAGIETRPFFYPAHALPPYASGLDFPVADWISERGINLP